MSLIVPGFESPDTISEVQTATVGNSWVSQSITGNWIDLAWSPENTKFIATDGTTDDRVLTSSNGTTWTTVSVTNLNSGGKIVWSNKFVAIAPNNEAAESLDGTTWTSFTTSGLSTAGLDSLIWVSEIGYCGIETTSGDFAKSGDGITWTTTAITNSSGGHVAWSPELSLLAYAGFNGGSQGLIAYSSDLGDTWTTSQLGTNIYRSIAWSSKLSRFVASAPSTIFATSTNGTSWTTYSESGSVAGFGIVWSPQVELFVTCSDTPNIAYSSLGTSGSWTTLSDGSSDANGHKAIVWSGELENFYIIGNVTASRSASSYSNLVQTSQNGTQGVTEYLISGGNVNIGESANLVTIGKYSNSVDIGSPGIPVSILGTFMGVAVMNHTRPYGANNDGGRLDRTNYYPRYLNTISTYGNIDCTLFPITFNVTTPSSTDAYFRLGKGTYLIEAHVPGYQTWNHNARLYDATNNVLLVKGSNTLSSNTGANSDQTYSIVKGIFAMVDNTKPNLEIQHVEQNNGAVANYTGGLSNFDGANGITTEQPDNIYTNVWIYRLF